MKVSKSAPAGYSYVNGASGHVSAVWEAKLDDGEVVARFRARRASGYSSANAWVRDASGRPLQGPVFVHKLSDFRAWANDGFCGAWVRIATGRVAGLPE